MKTIWKCKILIITIIFITFLSGCVTPKDKYIEVQSKQENINVINADTLVINTNKTYGNENIYVFHTQYDGRTYTCFMRSSYESGISCTRDYAEP